VSSGRAGTETSASSTDNLSLGARIAGVVRHPRSTFEAIVQRPQFAGLLTLLVVVSFAASAAFLVTGVGQLALVDQWERTAVAFGQPVDDARYAAFQELSARGVSYAAVTTTAGMAAATVALAAVLFGVFAAGLRGTPSYRQVLAVTTHAAVILGLRNVVAAPVNYARESLASPLTLGLFFTAVDEGSPVARFLALIDLFAVWWLAVLAIGIGVLYQRRVRTVAAAFLGAYVAIAVLLAGVMAVLGGT
jgi:hypothetical protein